MQKDSASPRTRLARIFLVLVILVGLGFAVYTCLKRMLLKVQMTEIINNTRSPPTGSTPVSDPDCSPRHFEQLPSQPL